MTEEPRIGTIEWAKSLSDDALEAVRDVMKALQENDGWYSDWDFDIEQGISQIYDILDKERLFRVGIALGIRPEKVRKTLHYDETGEQRALDNLERRISIAEADFEEDSQYKTGDGPL